MSHNQNKAILYSILLLFLAIKIFQLVNQAGISWDGSVYLGMGKYIFSSGKIGLWESSRPLAWPILLGVLWKTGLNPILFGRILALLFSAGCILLTYALGKNIFNEKIGLLSAFLLAFSPAFIFYSSTLLTDIPSTLFALASVYFFIKKRHFLAGLSIGLSAMTRFLQLFIIIPIAIILVINSKNRIRQLAYLIAGLLTATLPYLILNFILYKNPLHPFLLQAFMSKYTGWIFHQPLQFYLINIAKEDFLLVFAVIGIPLLLAKPNSKRVTILSILLLFFFFFSAIAHKEARFMITFMPYLYLIASFGFFSCLRHIKAKRKIFCSMVILAAAIWLFQEIPQIKTPDYKEYPEFQKYVNNKDVADNIWVSSPIFIAGSDKKADELIYYPLYSTKKISQLKIKLKEAEHILINTCDMLPCPPEDKNCEEETINLLDSIKMDFQAAYSQKEQDCIYLIFKRKKAIS